MIFNTIHRWLVQRKQARVLANIREQRGKAPLPSEEERRKIRLKHGYIKRKLPS